MATCKLSKEELINLLKEFYDKNRRSPKLKELTFKNGFPSRRVYYRVFETTTWNDILSLAGLEKNRTTKNKYNKEDLKDMLVEYYKKNGQVPTCTELGVNNYFPTAIVFYDRFNTQSWNEILVECGLPMNHYQGYTKENMIDILKDIYAQYSKIPTYEEWCEYKIMPNHGQYARVFGSIENACYLAGLIDRPLSKDEKDNNSINMLEKLAEILERIPTVFEYEKYLSNLELVCSTRRDLEKHLGMSYSDICSKYLEEYEYNHNTIGIYCKDNNGEMCRSTAELQITNFLIHNNIEYIKEYPYKNITNNDKDSRRMDWKVVVNNVDYYVEYFGMYRHNTKKIGDRYRAKTHSKIEDLKKCGVLDRCIFIYPNDLRKKAISEIFNSKLKTNFNEYIYKTN